MSIVLKNLFAYTLSVKCKKQTIIVLGSNNNNKRITSIWIWQKCMFFVHYSLANISHKGKKNAKKKKNTLHPVLVETHDVAATS